MFQASGNEWAGDMESEDLFNLWLKMKTETGEEIVLHHTVEETPISNLDVTEAEENLIESITGVIESNEIFKIVENSESILVDDFKNNLNFFPRYEIIDHNQEHSHDSILQIQNDSSNAGILLPVTDVTEPVTLANIPIMLESKIDFTYQDQPLHTTTTIQVPLASTSEERINESNSILNIQKSNLNENSLMSTGNENDKENETDTCFGSAFSKVFFWPQKNQSTNGQMRKKKEKVPAVVVSKKWREFHEEKEKQKDTALQQKEESKEKKIKK